MRIYTATTPDNLPMVSVNAGSVAEARNVLTSILGSDDGMLVRIATAGEADAWRATASSVERHKLRKVKKAPDRHANRGIEVIGEREPV